MLKLIDGPVEILRKDPETQTFPICDKAGFTIGAAETYGHALEISEAVGNYNKVMRLLVEARASLRAGPVGQRIQKKISQLVDHPALVH